MRLEVVSAEMGSGGTVHTHRDTGKTLEGSLAKALLSLAVTYGQASTPNCLRVRHTSHTDTNFACVALLLLTLQPMTRRQAVLVALPTWSLQRPLLWLLLWPRTARPSWTAAR